MLLTLWLACLDPSDPPGVEASPQAMHRSPDQAFPHAAPRSRSLARQLDALRIASADARHREADGRPVHVNRLALESSAYLLQHAHNPVDWFPWGDEAFEQARVQGKPVLLSIGYRTCHWCHVMEEESFEDPEIAAYINEHFVPIKVDREELPDVDAVYMAATQALMRGHGGWPMTVFLTPDRAPFHAATYLPARDGDRGRPFGLLTVLQEMHEAWTNRRDELDRASADLTTFVVDHLEARAAPADLPGPDLLMAAHARALAEFDPQHGGRAGRPKFPSGWPLRFAADDVLSGHQALDDELRLTLDAMATGGLYDVVGGGFHRYATDEAWAVPHFEKMLYDNALLAGIYLDGWRRWRQPAHAEVVRGIFRDQLSRASDGTFAAAVDADSPAPGHGEPVEGGYYTFTPVEVSSATPDMPPEVLDRIHVDPAGPVDGRSPLALEAVDDLVDPSIRRALDALGEARAHREAPFVDTKPVVAWNGLMLSAMARTARFLDPVLMPRAEALGHALYDAVDARGRLPRVVGSSAPGMLRDEAFVAAGFVDLYEATGTRRWLDAALQRSEVLDAHFALADGSWAQTPSDAGTPLARPRADRDGAEPSGASVHVRTLLRLASITGDDAYRERADRALRAYAEPLAAGDLDDMLPAVAWRHGRPLEIVLVAPDSAEHDPTLREAVDRLVHRHHVRLLAREDDPDALEGTVASGKLAHGGATTVYVCEAGMCQAPVTGPEGLRRVLSLVTRTPETPGRAQPGADAAER